MMITRKSKRDRRVDREVKRLLTTPDEPWQTRYADIPLDCHPALPADFNALPSQARRVLALYLRLEDHSPCHESMPGVLRCAVLGQKVGISTEVICELVRRVLGGWGL